MRKKKVAVIGGGIFGVTIASRFAKVFSVDLFEKDDDILKAASGINQFRLHRGYHYPRSPETVTTSIKSQRSFESVYGKAVIRDSSNYYCIANEHSKTSKKQYLDFLKKNNLNFEIVNQPLINKARVALTVKVKEDLLDPKFLKDIAWKNLSKNNVKVHLNTFANNSIANNFDFLIVATYAGINRSLNKKGAKREYQFELCEKIVVSLPTKFKHKSIVILDGPFMCIDPYGTTGNFLMGNVVHAIHHRNIGYNPIVPQRYEKLLNKGIIANPPVTNFKKFISSAKHFIPSIDLAKHVGSMYTVRAVLPYKDKTDERLTTIGEIDNKIFTVFSGKISTCVNTADELLSKISS